MRPNLRNFIKGKDAAVLPVRMKSGIELQLLLAKVKARQLELQARMVEDELARVMGGRKGRWNLEGRATGRKEGRNTLV